MGNLKVLNSLKWKLTLLYIYITKPEGDSVLEWSGVIFCPFINCPWAIFLFKGMEFDHFTVIKVKIIHLVYHNSYTYHLEFDLRRGKSRKN